LLGSGRFEPHAAPHEIPCFLVDRGCCIFIEEPLRRAFEKTLIHPFWGRSLKAKELPEGSSPSFRGELHF
jgi:hypothetical protein